MLKKLLILFISVIFISLSAFAYTSTLLNDSIPSEKDTVSQIQTDTEVVKNHQQNKNAVKDRIKSNHDKRKKLKRPDEFRSITECNRRAKRDNVAAYVGFICKNDFSDDELEVINRILENGTTIQSLKEVYEFWLTTDEDFDMIEKICALEDEYFSIYWYESAFNKLTDYVHGELTAEEIIDYQTKGISTDSILAANVMCRKKGQNIKSILDSAVDGTSLESQAKAIYGSEPIDGESLFEAVTALAKPPKNRVYKLSAEDTFYEAVDDIISDELKELGIAEDKIAEEDDYTSLKNCNYPLNVQKALRNKGFTPQEIEKSAEISERNIFVSAKKAREMMANEE